ARYSPEAAVLGVTRGALTQLTRDELQGVIGHEFSHILNGDMRLNIRLMGLLHGILFVYLAGRALLYTRNSRSNAGSVLGLALMVIGSSGVLCGRLIQSAVSRQREFLADAAAVQFTRNLEGVASALEKLAEIGSRLASPHAEAARHIFFGSAMGRAWAGDWFATHPPLQDRIARLRGIPAHRGRRSGAVAESRVGAMGFADSSGPIAPESVVAQVGTVSPEHYAYTQGLLAQIPDDLRLQLRDTQGAIAAIYALFLNPTDEAVYEHQLQRLGTAETESTLVEAIQMGHDVQSLDPRLRLPLLDLAIPALRACPLERLETLIKGLQDLAQADGTWTVSEFALFLVLQRRLEMQGPQGQARTGSSVGLDQLWDESLTLLSALASAGDTHPNAIAYAFRCGAFKLPTAAQETVPEQGPDWTLDTVRQSLDRLRQADAQAKQALVNACAHTVLLDPDVTIQEAELLRAIAIVLDCPIPPFLNALRSVKGASKSSRTGAV
ncbi:MAG: M48 family metalloprotease, partial [Thermosynechococcaceae cyanobacterium]